MSELYIQGGRELAEKLRQVGPKLEKRVMRGALRAGAMVFVRAMRANAASAPIAAEARKRLARSFVASTNVRGAPGTVIAGVTMKSVARKDGKTRGADDPRIWQLWLEKGTGERFRGRRGKRAALRRALTGAGTGRTGRMSAHPVAHPAFESAAGEAFEAVASYVRKRLEAEVTR